MASESRAVLRAEKLSTHYGRRDVLRGLELEIEPGKVTAILGPNGCGKSTLLHALARVLEPSSGAVLLDGRDLRSQPTRAVARELALLPQTPRAPSELTVRDLVSFGRFPHRAWLAGESAADRLAVDAALAAVRLSEFGSRPLLSLSGGERQRAWIALALAQGTRVLLLDEPTSSLDIAHQLELLELVRTLNEQHAKTVVMVLHDIGLAARYADRLVLLRDGAVRAQGAPLDVLTADVLRDVFGIEGRVALDRELGIVTFTPHRAMSDRAPQRLSEPAS